MGLVLVTGPAAEPVTPDECKEQCRVDGDTEDAYINRLLRAARLLVEADTRRALIRQKWRLTLDGFPNWEFCLPKPHLLDLAPTMDDPDLGIVYEDTSGADVTMDTTDYRLSSDDEPARITPPHFGYWPITSEQVGNVRITFQSGYGDNPEDVPDGIKQAILFAVAHWYKNREPVVEGTMMPMPMAFDRLLDDYRCTEIR